MKIVVLMTNLIGSRAANRTRPAGHGNLECAALRNAKLQKRLGGSALPADGILPPTHVCRNRIWKGKKKAWLYSLPHCHIRYRLGM